MKKSWLIVSFILVSSTIFAQQMILMDPVSARVFNSHKYSDIQGSPFLYDKWTAGSAFTSEGYYNNLELKYDVYNSTLLFKRDDQSYEFRENIIAFILMPVPSDSATYQYFRKGISGAQVKPDQYVQVLVEGPVSLYKSDIKSMSDLNVINSGVVKTFSNSSRYFILKDNVLQLVKMNKQEVMNFIKDKESEVQSFIINKKLSIKREDHLVEILKYYNSLAG